MDRTEARLSPARPLEALGTQANLERTKLIPTRRHAQHSLVGQCPLNDSAGPMGSLGDTSVIVESPLRSSVSKVSARTTDLLFHRQLIYRHCWVNGYRC
jgi:hypothetical protein